MNNELFDVVLQIHQNNTEDKEFLKMLAECVVICDEIQQTNNPQKLNSSFQPKPGAKNDYLIAIEPQSNKVIGAMNLLRRPSIDTIHISATIVSPEFQGRGISQQMFKYLENHAKLYKEFTSVVHTSNTQSLDSRLVMGFKVRGVVATTGDRNNRLYKPVDDSHAIKTFEESQPEAVTIFPKKKSMQNLNNKAPSLAVGGNSV